MIRAIGMFGLGGIFLVISPSLRMQVFTTLGKGVSFMTFYAPYTYIVGGILVFISMIAAFNSGARAR